MYNDFWLDGWFLLFSCGQIIVVIVLNILIFSHLQIFLLVLCIDAGKIHCLHGLVKNPFAAPTCPQVLLLFFPDKSDVGRDPNIVISWIPNVILSGSTISHHYSFSL